MILECLLFLSVQLTLVQAEICFGPGGYERCDSGCCGEKNHYSPCCNATWTGIVGGISGTVFVIAIIVLICCCVRRRRNQGTVVYGQGQHSQQSMAITTVQHPSPGVVPQAGVAEAYPQSPPTGYQPQPGGYQPTPIGYKPPPAGYQPPPSYQAPPPGYKAPPQTGPGYQPPASGGAQASNLQGYSNTGLTGRPDTEQHRSKISASAHPPYEQWRRAMAARGGDRRPNI